jgi:hypothetical protein
MRVVMEDVLRLVREIERDIETIVSERDIETIVSEGVNLLFPFSFSHVLLQVTYGFNYSVSKLTFIPITSPLSMTFFLSYEH